MKIDFIPCDPSNYRSGRGGNGIRYIVMHYTANNGDTAANNGRYFQNGNLSASAHYFVDEKSIVQSVRDDDTAWHCGGALESSHHPLHGICMNRNSIGVEMCSDIVGGRYTITAATVDRAVELVKYLMGRYNVPADRVVRHYDVTGKDCPEPWVRDESKFTTFKKRLTERVEDMTEAQTRAIAKQEIRSAAEKVYNRPKECPQWAQETVQKLVNKGFLQGDENGNLALTESLMRILVINDRAHLYG